jgi:hypothetical protein
MKTRRRRRALHEPILGRAGSTRICSAAVKAQPASTRRANPATATPVATGVLYLVVIMRELAQRDWSAKCKIRVQCLRVCP